jgi:hypothetical protein
MQRSASASGSTSVLGWGAEETVAELRLAEGAVICVRNFSGFIDRKIANLHENEWESGGIFPFILNLNTGLRSVIKLMPRLLCLQAEGPR